MEKLITNSDMRYLLLLVSSASLTMAADANIYTTQVVPLLTTHCYECHGPKKAKHDLRLDSLEGILKGGKELGPAIIVGKPEESPMIKLIKLPKGEDDSMPPKGPRLTEAEIAILSKWIADGGKAK